MERSSLAFPNREITLASSQGSTGDAADGRSINGPVTLTLRSLASDDDYAQCEALQKATWGEDCKEIANATMMMISQKVGGVSAGAFDQDGRMRGLVIGISGVKDGRTAHWSHMLAVDPGFDGHGLGRQLKAYQRDVLLHLGIEVMYWSYDPLVARNAHLNIERLAAEPVEYVRDLYGDGGKNLQHRGLGTDRFIVRWLLQDPDVEPRLNRRPDTRDPKSSWPVVNSDADGRPLQGDFPLPELVGVRVEVPEDIQTLKDVDPGLALAWRLSTRRAFMHYLSLGYRIRGFRRLMEPGNRFFYLVDRDTVAQNPAS